VNYIHSGTDSNEAQNTLITTLLKQLLHT